MATAVTPPDTPKTTMSVDPLYMQAVNQAKTAYNAAAAPITAEQNASDASYQTQQDNSIAEAEALSKLLAPIAPQVNGFYQTAAQNQELAANGFSHGMQDALAGNTDNLNAELAKLNAPVTLDSHAGQAGDVLYALGGYNPGTAFAKEGAGFASAAAMLPGTALLKGQDNAQALRLQGLAADKGFQAKLADLAGKLPGDAQTNYLHLRTLALSDAKFAETVRNDNFSRILKSKEFNLAVGKANNQVDEFNARQALASNRLNAAIQHWKNTEAISAARLANSEAKKSGTASKINLGVSNLLGYLADSSGNPIAGRGGKVIYTDTLPGNLKKMIPNVTGSILNAQKKGFDAGAAFKQITLANPTIPQKIVRGEIVRIYGAANVPTWMIPLPPGATPLPNTGAWSHANLPVAQQQFANFVLANAARYKIDPNAVLAVSRQEGFGGGIGDNNTSFGPFQLHIGGALPSWVAARGVDYAQHWAWSEQGWDYALRSISKVARGKTGQAAVNAIVRRFERPANPAGEYAGAMGAYGQPPS